MRITTNRNLRATEAPSGFIWEPKLGNGPALKNAEKEIEEAEEAGHADYNLEASNMPLDDGYS